MAKRRKKPNVVISSTQKAMRVPRKKIPELVDFVSRCEGATVADVDIAVVDKKEMAAMNRKYLQHIGPTDVLSFDLSDNLTLGIVAQLVVCGDVAVTEAKARGHSPARELMLYVVHGLLHMMGYEDSSVRGAAKMHAREEELLEDFLHKRQKKQK